MSEVTDKWDVLNPKSDFFDRVISDIKKDPTLQVGHITQWEWDDMKAFYAYDVAIELIEKYDSSKNNSIEAYLWKPIRGAFLKGINDLPAIKKREAKFYADKEAKEQEDKDFEAGIYHVEDTRVYRSESEALEEESKEAELRKQLRLYLQRYLPDSEHDDRIDMLFDRLGIQNVAGASPLTYPQLADKYEKTGSQKHRINEVKKDLNEINRILVNHPDYKKLAKFNKTGDVIGENDMALLRYIAESNGRCDGQLKYPNSDDIIRDLSGMFNCRDTVSRSIKRLREIKGCVFALRGRHRGYELMNKEDVLGLTTDDLLAVSIMQYIVRGLPQGPVKHSFETVLSTLLIEMKGRANLGEDLIQDDEPIGIQLDLSLVYAGHKDCDYKLFSDCFLCARRHFPCSFQYTDTHNNTYTVTGHPHYIFLYHGDWLALIFSEEKNMLQWYSMNRMSSFEIHRDAHFRLQNDFHAGAYIKVLIRHIGQVL